MNRKMPSKGCDPAVYNLRVGMVREARRAVQRTKKNPNPVVQAIAKMVFVLVEQRRDAVLHPERPLFDGSLSKQAEWVLRA